MSLFIFFLPLGLYHLRINPTTLVILQVSKRTKHCTECCALPTRHLHELVHTLILVKVPRLINRLSFLQVNRYINRQSKLSIFLCILQLVEYASSRLSIEEYVRAISRSNFHLHALPLVLLALLLVDFQTLLLFNHRKAVIVPYQVSIAPVLLSPNVITGIVSNDF